MDPSKPRYDVGDANALGGQCKQRFKGVENFLRKIAFNLGNSPSQTEVKIISCIPIDVTDLQQKIICLEKELDEVKSCKPTDARTVATVTVKPHVCWPPDPAPTASNAVCGPCRSKDCNSGDSFENDCGCQREFHISNLCDQQMETETLCNQPMIKKGKLKNAYRKGERSHFVYYAQTESGPFATYQNQKRVANNASLEAKDAGISRTYISEMIQKQYAAEPIVKEFPICNQISSPVCRDMDSGPDQLWFKTTKYDSDVCSCLHGTFHNIDNHPINRIYDKNNPQPTCSYSNNSNNSDFYDTSLYDMVPVKEKPVRPPHVQEVLTKRKLRNVVDIDATRFSERNRQKYRYHPFYPKEMSMCVNYSKIPNEPIIFRRKPPEKLADKKERHTIVTPYSKTEEVMRELERNQDRSCSFDCGNVYAKRVHGNVKPQPAVTPVATVSHKNAECLTNNVKDIDCQTTTSQSVQIDNELLHDDKKTEDTLNQIKVILQTVLTEVKTNTQVKKIPEEKPTKDAVVQKGLSQGMIPGCSTVLNSYTYSPYNMHPYMSSCSRQIPPCYPNMPYVSRKCLQNYPVFVQNPMQRNICTCYRNTSIVTNQIKAKPAATTATNTDFKERNNETHSLIKEIYKSIKVNMDMPAKDTSASEYEGLRSDPRSLELNNVREDKIVTPNTDTKQAQQKSTSPFSSSNNKLNSSSVSLRSQIVNTTDTENYLRNKRIDSYLDNLELQKARQNRIDEEYETSSRSSSEAYSDAEKSEGHAVSPLYEPEKKTEKRGIFSKMFRGPFKLFKNKPKKKEEEIQVENESESEESETESDGYQTIYSQKEAIGAPHHVAFPMRSAVRPRVHSKISFSRKLWDRNQDRYRRSPYMEQEYRRQWDEKLMFRENQRDSTETTRSRTSDPRLSSPTYWRGYEARSAFTGPDRSEQPGRIDTSVIAPSLPPHIRTRGVTLKIPKKNSSFPTTGAKGISWIKKHKPACAGQWKKIILES